MTIATTLSSEHTAQRDALALIITNAYRARHRMPPVTYHASVDEDIAEAIMHAGWTAPENSISETANPGTDKIAILNEALSHGVGSVTSSRAKHIRGVAMHVMEQHSDWTDRNDEHAMYCTHDSLPWPCPEYNTARTAYINAGGNPDDV